MKNFNPVTSLFITLFYLLSTAALTAQISPPIEISCGETVSGSTVNAPKFFDGNFYECDADLSSFGYNSGESIFQLDLAEAKSVSIQLESTGVDLDIFLYSTFADSVGGFFPSHCRAVGISETDSFEGVITTLDKGVYWLILDSRLNDEGAFKLSLSCFDLPDVCDIEGSLISPGNPVFNPDVFFGEIPAANFLFESCVQSELPDYFDENGFPMSSVVGQLYTYYHEGPEDSFSIDFDPGIKITAFLFSCVNDAATCLGILSPGTNIFNNTPTGFYKIAVVSRDPDSFHFLDSAYSLSVQGDGPCGGGDIVVLEDSNDVISDKVKDAGNNFGRQLNDVYASCYNGPRDYEGEDKVFYLVSDTENNDDELDMLYIELFLDAPREMGVFVYDYLCGENCLGYVETPDTGGISDTLTLNLKAKSSYYLVVDSEKNAGGSGGTDDKFTLTYKVTRLKKTCDIEKKGGNDHVVSFSPNSSVFLGNETRLYYSYEFNPDASFDNNAVSRPSENGEISAVELPYQPNLSIENGFKKCGYDIDERMVLIGVKQDGTCVEIDANYQTPDNVIVTARDSFKLNGKSHIINMSVKEVGSFPMLDINPVQKDLPKSRGETISAILQCSTNWSLVKKPNWITQVIPGQGLGDTKIDIVVSENTTNLVRTGKLVFKSPLHEVDLLISQPPSVCAANPIMINLEQIQHPDCTGRANGNIDISAHGGGGQYQFTWGNEVGNVENLEDLSAGTYQVTVTDVENCSVEASFTLIDPPAISINTLNAIDVACNGETNGSITIDAAGGTGTLSYLWDNDLGETQNPQNLGPGTYTVNIIDQNNCAVQESITINEPTAIQITNSSVMDVRCYGDTNGSITVNATGGTDELGYQWDQNIGNVQHPQDLPAGSYMLTITDIRSCKLTQSFVISEPEPILVTLDTIFSDSGSSDGAIQILIDGGTPGYTFSWSGEGSFSSEEQNPSGLAAGDYQLTLTDNNGCTFNQTFTVDRVTGLVEELLKKNIDIFPNPAEDFIYLRKEGLAGKAVQAALVNAFGQKVRSLFMVQTGLLYEMDVGQLPTGIYWLQLGLQEGLFTRKMIIH